jgi:hypothetical protein
VDATRDHADDGFLFVEALKQVFEPTRRCRLLGVKKRRAGFARPSLNLSIRSDAGGIIHCHQ